MFNATMKFDLGEDVNALRDAVHRFAQDRIKPLAAEVDRSNVFPAALWREMGDMGLLGITVSEEFGGAGMSYLAHVIAVEEIARASASVSLSYGAHSNLCVNQIKLNGNAEQKQKYLPKLATGELSASFALTEPEAGSDAASLRTTAIRGTDSQGDHYIVNGTKRYITNAPHADVALIMARTSKEALPKNAHVSAFLVPMDSPGVSRGSPDKKMGQSGSHISDIMLDDVRVPGEALLGGDEGKTHVRPPQQRSR